MEFPGHLAQLYIRNPDNTWARVQQVRDIDTSGSSDTIDAGHRDTGSWGAQLPGAKSGELKFDVVLDMKMHRRLRDAFDNSKIETWRIDWNDDSGEVWEIRGGLSQYDASTPYNGVRTANFTVPYAGRPLYLDKYVLQEQEKANEE